MPTGSIPGTSSATSSVPPGVFATSMSPLGSMTLSANPFQLNGSSSVYDSRRTPSPEAATAAVVVKPHKGNKRSFADSFKGTAHPLKVTIRRIEGDHSTGSHSPSRGGHAESYTCEKAAASDISNNNGHAAIEITNNSASKQHQQLEENHHHPSSSSPSADLDQTFLATSKTSDDPPFRNATTCTLSSATLTEPEHLGPCEPGSRLVLDGVVWAEIPGMLVLNVNWRGRQYVGSLIDATKNTLGPSCPDKSLSSLSLLRGRGWRGGHAGLYRNRPSGSLARPSLVSPRHHGPHLHHHHYHLAGLGSLHGPVTTRSASAAAANPSGSNGGSEVESKAPGTRRRSRRNGRVFSPGTPTAPTDSPETQQQQQQQQEAGVGGHPLETSADRLLSPTSSSVAAADSYQPFQCPFEGCDKKFNSLISLRFHSQMGHQTGGGSGGSSTARRPGKAKTTMTAGSSSTSSKQADTTKSVHIRKRRKNVSGTATSQEASVETSPVSTWKAGASPVLSPRKPPKLAKVESEVKAKETLPATQNEESRSNFNATPDDMDDELPPPKLVVEEERILPVPSPAYSDISDDGSPAEMVSNQSIGLHPPALLGCTESSLFVPAGTVSAGSQLLTMDLSGGVCRPWIKSPVVDASTPLTVSTMYFNAAAAAATTPTTILSASPGIISQPHMLNAAVRAASPSIMLNNTTTTHSPNSISTGPQKSPFVISPQQQQQPQIVPQNGHLTNVLTGVVPVTTATISSELGAERPTTTTTTSTTVVAND